jgi:shikimate kinase
MAERVILTGFMGSGKTAVGRRLAQKTDMEFCDTDSLAEQRMGMSINTAFDQEGESFFRDQEEAVIREQLGAAAASGRGRVISLGGGAITTMGIQELLEQEENVVLLDSDVATAFERSRGGDRPLARSRESFEQLYATRKELYRRLANMVIDVDDKSVEELVDEIIELLEGRA